jgi:hypothetical protein
VITKTIAEKLALRMLAGTGDAVVRNAHAAAAAARCAGRLEVAAALAEIADAAERLALPDADLGRQPKAALNMRLTKHG